MKCGASIPAGKTFLIVKDESGNHVGDSCYPKCLPKNLVRRKLEEIAADERLSYPTATVFENAPLALVQCGLQNQINALKWVLKVLEGES
jgi:hypothetical protein